eukprot:CCRYP_011285-RA/>CCRYP_011285-RA protein AED:0.41 eAED:0.41 QI:0/-1/0/1/-1/1/1/0/94
MSDMHQTIQQCLATANEQLKSLMHHQIMTHAPSTVRKKYFEDLYCTMAMEMTNKRRRLELEEEELAIRRREVEVRRREVEVRESLMQQEGKDCH